MQGAAGGAAEAQVPVRKPEARFFVVLLLRRHAVQADVAVSQPFQGAFPQRRAVAVAPIFFFYDIQADEAERAVTDGGYAADALPRAFSDKKPFGVRAKKAFPVRQAGIPALLFREPHDEAHVLKLRAANGVHLKYLPAVPRGRYALRRFCAA